MYRPMTSHCIVWTFRMKYQKSISLATDVSADDVTLNINIDVNINEPLSKIISVIQCIYQVWNKLPTHISSAYRHCLVFRRHPKHHNVPWCIPMDRPTARHTIQNWHLVSHRSKIISRSEPMYRLRLCSLYAFLTSGSCYILAHV